MKNISKYSVLVVIVLITLFVISASKSRSDVKQTSAEIVKGDFNYEGIALQDKDSW